MGSAGPMRRVRIRTKLSGMASLSGLSCSSQRGILDLGELGANPSFYGHYVPSIMGRKLRKLVHGIDFFAFV